MRPKLENDVPRFVEQSHGQFAGWLGQSYEPLTIDADPSRADTTWGILNCRPKFPPDDSEQRRRAARPKSTRRSSALERDAALGVFDGHYRKAFELLDSAPAATPLTWSKSPPPARRVRASTHTARACCRRGGWSSEACRW